MSDVANQTRTSIQLHLDELETKGTGYKRVTHACAQINCRPRDMAIGGSLLDERNKNNLDYLQRNASGRVRGYASKGTTELIGNDINAHGEM